MSSLQFIDIHTHLRPPANHILAIQNLHNHFHQHNPLFYYSAGIHPRYINEDSISEDFLILKNELLHDNFLAVGECGLDRLSDLPLPAQEKIFIWHIQLANELAKPLIIHCVKAHHETLQLLRDYQVNVPVIFHGFNNKYETAKMILDQGYYLSIGKSIMNPNMENTFCKLPANKILMETDKGERNIESMYHQACRLRNISLRDWQLQIRQNFSNIFPNLPA